MTPQEFYEQQRQIGNTDDITSNPDPDYDQDFYRNIFYLMAEYHSRMQNCDGCRYKKELSDAEDHINELHGRLGAAENEIDDLERQRDIGRYGYGD